MPETISVWKMRYTSLQVLLVAFSGIVFQLAVIEPAHAIAPNENTDVTLTIVLPPSTPIITPDSGAYTSIQTISISSAGADSIRYTVNGTDPTCETGNVYTAPFILSSSANVKAIGCDSNLNASTIASNEYTITIPNNTPSRDLGGGAMTPVYPKPITKDVVLALTFDQIEKIDDYTARVWIHLDADPKTVRGYMLSTDPTFVDTAIMNYTPWVSILVPIKPNQVVIYGRYYSTTGHTSDLVGVLVDLSKKIAPPSDIPCKTMFDPADKPSLLAWENRRRDLEKEDLIVHTEIRGDEKEFGLAFTDAQVNTMSDFIICGFSPATISFGQGERRAMVRDFMDTVHYSNISWLDIERMATGRIAVMRNLKREQTHVVFVLPIFRRIFGHDPNFKNHAENLAWSALMYRIRFPRDLVKERGGITAFLNQYKHYPTTPLNWSTVRVMGYIK